MKLDKDFLEITAVAILAFSYFLFIHLLIDYPYGQDSFFHTKISEIYGKQGLIRSFPWMKYTIFNSNYADPWFVFHVAQIPFTFGDLILGLKLFVSLISTLVILAFYFIMKKMDMKYPWLWTALILSSGDFIWRMVLGRAYILADLFLILGFYFLSKKNYKGLFAVSFLFPMTYSAFPLILFFVFVFMVSEYVHNRSFDRKILTYCLLGIGLGLLINPYFPSNIFHVIQELSTNISLFLIKTDIPTEYLGMVIPGEGRAPAWDFTKTTFLLLIVLAFGIENYLFSNRSSFSKKKVETTASLIILVPFVILFITSMRFMEYWVPFAALACALLIEPEMDRLSKKYRKFKVSKRKISVVGMASVLIFVILIPTSFYWTNDMYTKAGIPTDNVSGLTKDLSEFLAENTPEGSFVFLPWDMLAPIFFFNDQNSYPVGLNLMYLYLYNNSLFDSYVLTMLGEGDVYNNLVNDFQADYLAITWGNQDLQSKVEEDIRFTQMYNNSMWVLYKID
jgi:hypothetical protein